MIAAPTASKAKIQAAQSGDLRLMEECSGRNDGALYEMRASAVTQVLYIHSYQNHAFSLSRGMPVYLPEHGYGTSQIFNVMLPVIMLQKALLLAQPPRRDAYATTRDNRDIEAARYTKDLMSWAEQEHVLEEVADEAATQFCEIGDFIFFVGWDPTAGRSWLAPDGSEIFEGAPIWRCDSKLEWNFHPHAKNYRESPYAYRISYVSRDWALEHYPEFADQMPEDLEYSSGAPVLQRTLLNLGPTSGYRGGTLGKGPKKEQYVEFHELYFRSSPKRPAGLCMFAIGEGGMPKTIVHKGENPYAERKTGRRTLPVVHAKQISRSGGLWGESLAQHMIPMQNYINAFEEIIEENATMVGSPFGTYEQDGICPDNWTNVVGNLLPRAPGSPPPQWVPPPELSSFLAQAPERCMQYLNNLVNPMGPLQQEAEGNVSSGVQQAIVNEGKQIRVAPMMKAWEMAWDAAWKLYIDNWANFASIPRKIGVVGADGGWRSVYFSGALASANFSVEIVPGSSMPSSHQGEVGTWIELSKTPPMQMAMASDPGMMKRFLEDIGKGDLTRTKNDPYVHKEKARRNIAAVKLGEVRQVDPLVDNLLDHIEVYQTYMASAEYEDEIRKDPGLDVRMRLLLTSFLNLQIAMAQKAQEQMMAMQGGGEEGGGPPEAQGARGAAEGGDGGYPRKHQGFGKQPSSAKNNGGRPSSGNSSGK